MDHQLYFSHSYALEDLRFNEHFWKLLMGAGFHAWIDNGLDISPAGNLGQPGARRPMDVSFNEWMMSRCHGFVAIAPKRKSAYQLLEYRTAVRMGVPRLVLLQEGGNFNADETEIVTFPTSWQLFWQDIAQSDFVAKIEGFAELVRSHETAGEVLKSAGRWRPRQNIGQIKVALLAPRAGDSEWQELQKRLQRLRQKDDEADWTLLSPANLRTERALLDQVFDLLVVDVGPRGTPLEVLGYIHAIGIPQIRLCQVHNGDEMKVLGRFLDAEPWRELRSVYEQDPPNEPVPVSMPRFLDGFKLDREMQPVIFWSSIEDAADMILDTTRRIHAFRSGLSPEEGGIAQAIDSHQSAKKYFDRFWQRAGRGSVFISFAGQGGASELADRLAQILRFLNLRCFHYRDKDSNSDGRLESGEDVVKGLEVRIDEADIVVYLIEENFVASTYCRSELDQGLRLRKQGLIEFRAYSLDTLKTFPPGLEKNSPSVHNFRYPSWTHTDVEQRIVADVEDSAEALGWALREKERGTLAGWLKQDQRDNIQAVSKLLRSFRAPENEIKSIADVATGDAWLNALLRLPKDRDKKPRARQIVALLLLAVMQDKSERQKTVAGWLHERRLLRWPTLVAFESEDPVAIVGSLIKIERDLTIGEMKTIGQKLGQAYGDVLRSSLRPLCVSAETNFLAVPFEWACESQDDEPIAVRRPVRWRLPDVHCRPCVFDSIAANNIPPTALILSLAAPDINPSEQLRRLNQRLRTRYEVLGWPPEFVDAIECRNMNQVLERLHRCQAQVVHFAGHMGGEGLQVSGELVRANDIAAELRVSDVRIVVLNGCEGGESTSPVASAYLTLADRLMRDAHIPEIVAHRCKITESDAINFGEAFHAAFFNNKDGFDPSKSALEGRIAGSSLLRFSPVVISQREAAGSLIGGRDR
jgi:hypothetical protein